MGGAASGDGRVRPLDAMDGKTSVTVSSRPIRLSCLPNTFAFAR